MCRQRELCMENISFKTLLIRLLQDVYAAQQTWQQGLSQEERSTSGTMERWSGKDLLAHLTFWRRRLILQLEMVQHEEPPEWPDRNDTNVHTFQQHQKSSLADILQDAEESQQNLLAMIQRFSEESLATQHYRWMHTNDSLGVAIMGAGYALPLEQMAQYYLDRNDLARATHIHETLVDQILHTNVPDSAKGIGLYNLACFYATHNILDKVMGKLQEALYFYPRLKEWALNDPDLVVIRHHIK